MSPQRADVASRCSPTGRRSTPCTAGRDGLVAGARPGTVLVDCSTVPPATLRGHADGHPAPSAPASSTRRSRAASSLAEAGKLTLMVGGEAADLERARPVLSALGGDDLPPRPAGHRRGHEARRQHRHLRAQPGPGGGPRPGRGGRHRPGGRLRRAGRERGRCPVRRLQARGVPRPGGDPGRVRARPRRQGSATDRRAGRRAGARAARRPRSTSPSSRPPPPRAVAARTSRVSRAICSERRHR